MSNDLGGGKSTKIVAFCKLHKCTLTTKQLKNRKCLSKGCFHLHKYENHTWWKYREFIKKSRKEKKQFGTNKFSRKV